MHISNAFKYSPITGNRLTKLGGYVFVDAEEKKKHYINPKPGVNLIIDTGTQILLGKRATDPKKGSWTLPGGFVDPGETLEQAVVREIKEELDLDIQSADISYLSSFCTEYEYQGIISDIVNATFVFKGKIEKEKLKPKDDVSEIKFFNYDEIPYDKIGFKSVADAIYSYLN